MKAGILSEISTEILDMRHRITWNVLISKKIVLLKWTSHITAKSIIKLITRSYSEYVHFKSFILLSKSWFHGNISRSEAYNILVTNQNYNGTFLLRNNSSEKGKYTLCVYKK